PPPSMVFEADKPAEMPADALIQEPPSRSFAARPEAPPVQIRPAAAVASSKPAVPPVARPAPAQRASPQHVIALDPGHGGVDPGTHGALGTPEKSVTLAVARELRRQLEATGHYRVVMTRNRDETVRLRDRVARARAAKAELLVS